MNAGLYYGNQRIGTVRVAALDDNGNIILQEKIITPTKEKQTITYDSDYNGLSKVVVNAIPNQYINTTTSTTPTSADVANGKEVFANGDKITGTLPVKNNLTFTENGGLSISGSSLCATSTDTERYISNKATVNMQIDKAKLGNALQGDVAQGVTFTSANGVKLTGTHVCDTGADLSGVTATQDQVLEGAMTYVVGQENITTGSLKNCSKTSLTVSGPTVSIPTTGYYTAGQQASIPDQSNMTLKVNGGTVSIPANGYYTTNQSASIPSVTLAAPSATSATPNADGSITISTQYIHGVGYNATASTRTGSTTLSNVLNVETWTLTSTSGATSTLTVVSI